MYSKRDAFILMDADEPIYTESAQRCATYIIVKKTKDSVKIMMEYLHYCEDVRILTDADNVMGKENYRNFIDNRHDQTVWSILTKKHNLRAFRDPSQWGKNKEIEKAKCKNIALLTDYPLPMDYAVTIKPTPNAPWDNSYLDKDKIGLYTFEKQWDFVKWLNSERKTG